MPQMSPEQWLTLYNLLLGVFMVASAMMHFTEVKISIKKKNNSTKLKIKIKW